MNEDRVARRYLTGDYAEKNPDWDSADSPWKTRLAGLLRRLVYAVNRDIGARLLGGETLMVLARPRSDT